MKISLNWLREYVPVHVDTDTLSKTLTSTGLEVEEVELLSSGLEGFVVGEVLECDPHPNADRLRVCQVKVSQETVHSIVCGAPNVAKGQKVPVALPGTQINLPNGESFVIKKSKIRGEVSEGMICAEDEMGIGESHDGILVLDPSAIPGTPMSDYFGKSADAVIHIGITPNRTDALCHTGVARDLAAALKLPLQVPVSERKAEVGELIKVENHIPESVHQYYGARIQNVKIGPSPEWLKNRLISIGLNPVCNVVDVTNFILHELGQPMHAFQWDSVKEGLVFRNSLVAEKVKLLNAQEIQLPAGLPLICNSREILALAGVMGGKSSSIDESCSDIFLESAWFNASAVRKSSRLTGVRSDSSYRFERGTDPELPKKALLRAIDLIVEIAGGEFDGILLENIAQPFAKPRIDLEYSYFHRILGNKIADKDILDVLVRLDFEVFNVQEHSFSVLVPGNRVDVRRPIDVVEEFIRIYGLNSISDSGYLQYQPGVPGSEEKYYFRERLSDFLQSRGFTETLAKSFVDPKWILEEDAPENEWIKPMQPLSEELSVLRPSLVYSGLETTSYNQKRQQPDIRIFEIGKSYRKVDTGIQEQAWLGLWMSGSAGTETWNRGKRELDFFDIKSEVVEILRFNGISQWEESSIHQATFQSGIEIQIGQKVLARLGKISKKLAKRFDLKQDVYFAEISLSTLQPSKKQARIAEPSKFPSVRRDLALLVPESLKYKDLEKTAFKTEKGLLKEVILFDVYSGKNLEAGTKSYALGFMLRHEEKTLTDVEVDKVMQKLIATFEREHKAKIRS